MEIVAAIFLVVVAIGLIRSYFRKKRRERLMAKYGDANVVDRIMNQKIWQGMSDEQLIDSLGLAGRKRPQDLQDEDFRDVQIQSDWQKPLWEQGEGRERDRRWLGAEVIPA
jgi:hypothetical protein